MKYIGIKEYVGRKIKQNKQEQKQAENCIKSWHLRHFYTEANRVEDRSISEIQAPEVNSSLSGL
jgi:hypothetical protein